MLRPVRALIFAGLIFAAVVVVGCANGSTSPGAARNNTAPTEPSATVEPASEPTPEPSATVEPASEPTATPTATVEPASEPTATPTANVEPASEPTPESTPTATVEPASEPTATPTANVEPASEPTPESTPTPTVEPTSEPTPESTPSPVEPGDSGEKADLPPTNYDGEVRAIRTASGAVVAVRGVAGESYEVVTPCYNVASITGGLELRSPIDVLIDPGHGGDEPGAVGPNGLVEADVNLLVAELLRSELLDRGYSVEMTRYSDVRVAIQARAAVANSLAPRVFISVHHNGGFPEPFPVAGTEVFVQKGDPEGSRLGGLIFEEIQSAFSGTRVEWMGNAETFGVAWRENDEGTDLYGVLRRTPDLVSVLTEAMFISTEAEAVLLARPETLQTEATALADALERWFETDEPGSGFIEGLIFRGDLGNGGGTEGCIDPTLSS